MLCLPVANSRGRSVLVLLDSIYLIRYWVPKSHWMSREKQDCSEYIISEQWLNKATEITGLSVKIRACFKEIHHCTFRSQKLDSKFWTTLFTKKFLFILPNFQMTICCHCTNSLSSLHISIHHCTFCASLHVKTSPALWYKQSWTTFWIPSKAGTQHPWISWCGGAQR